LAANISAYNYVKPPGCFFCSRRSLTRPYTLNGQAFTKDNCNVVVRGTFASAEHEGGY
jgi:hypothetical protein